MDFILADDFNIFSQLIKKRPEINSDQLKKDLQSFYIPYAKKIIELKKQKNPEGALLVGVSAIQGAGKTTHGEVMEVLLKNFGYSSVSMSIDDHYLTHKQLCELRKKDPRFIRRGVTHDIDLAISDLKNLRNMEDGNPILVSGYDKGVQNGDGDRFRWINPMDELKVECEVIKEDLVVEKSLQKVLALKIISAEFREKELYLSENMGSDIPILDHFLPLELIEFLSNQVNKRVTVLGKESGTVYFMSEGGEVSVEKNDLPNGWRVVFQKCDFVFYDGWMLGVRPVTDESVFEQNLPALETQSEKEFAKFVNKKLFDYERLWELIEFLNVLYVVDYELSIKWRDQAEEKLREKGEGMSHEEIREFVYYFWRSVHPAVHIKNLAQDEEHTDQVVIINEDHSIKEVLSPKEVRDKYP